MADLFGIVIVRPFGLLLMLIYDWVQSYGMAVILFALLAQIILLPIGYKTKKSMRKMTAVQGKMQEIQKQYAGNKVRMNEEIQKLYEKEGVSPMGGCLPTFIQFPIIMGLYYAVQKPLTFMLGLSSDSIALLGQKVGIDVAQISSKSAGYELDIAQGLNQFLTSAGQFPSDILNLADDIKNYLVPINFNFFGLDLSQTPSFTHPSVIWILPILSGATAFLSSYQMQKNQGAQTSQAQNQMKSMMYLMPLISVYFGFIFPGSIGVYWVIRNVLMMLQEKILTVILNKRHPILSDIEKKELEKKEKRAAHEAKIRENTQQNVTPHEGNARKKSNKKK